MLNPGSMYFVIPQSQQKKTLESISETLAISRYQGAKYWIGWLTMGARRISICVQLFRFAPRSLGFQFGTILLKRLVHCGKQPSCFRPRKVSISQSQLS